MGIALPLINIFGEQPVRMLFSRSWTLREKAIQIIESEIIRGIMHPADGIIFGLILELKIKTDMIPSWNRQKEATTNHQILG